MVILNGKKFEVKKNDTTQSFLEKVAISLKTLPEYVIFDQNVNDENIHDEKFKISAKDMIKVIEKYESDFGQFYEENKEFIQTDISTVIKLYTAYNEQMNSPDMSEFVEIMLRQYLEQNYPDMIKDIPILIKNSKTYKKDTKSRISEFLDKSKNITNIYETLEKTKQVESTEFIYDKIFIEISLKNKESIFEIFDNLVLNEKICFAKLLNFTKIYKDITVVPEKWYNLNPREMRDEIAKLDSTNTNNEIIFVKTILDPNPNIIDISKKYSNVYIFYDKKGNLKIRIQTQKKNSEQEIDKILEKLEFVKTILQIENRQEIKISGSYLIPKQQFDKFIFADMVFMNPLFSEFLVSKETSSASNKNPIVNLTVKIPEQNRNAEISISGKVSNEMDSDTRNKNRIAFPYGQAYVKITFLNAYNIKHVEKIKPILDKLFTIYNKNYEDILEIYQSYMKDFKPSIYEATTDLGKLRPKDVAPEIFITNYPRVCGQQITVVDEEDITTKKEKKKKLYFYNDQQAIKFPKEVSEGEGQYYFVCNHKSHPYPGVIVNNLDNKEKYPYLPCCFQKDQINTRGSHYDVYYNDADVIETDKKQQNILITNKFVKYESLGYLPKNINSYFSVIDISNYYYRMGMEPSKHSFIDCILYAINPKFRELSKDKKAELVRTEKQRLLDYSRSIFIQNNLNPDLEKYMSDNVYFDPKVFRQMLEEVYNVNIFIFTRNDQDPNGTFLIDDFSKVLFINSYKDRNTIVLYEHMGAEEKFSENPMCELVIRADSKGENRKYVLEKEFNKGIYKFFNSYVKFYQMNNKIVPLTYHSIYDEISGLLFDADGKIRGFNTKDLTIFCDPITIFNIRMKSREFRLINSSLENARKFLKKYNISPMGYSICNEDNEKSNLYFEIGNTRYVIMCKISKEIEDLPKMPLYEKINEIHQNFLETRAYARRLLYVFMKLYLEQVETPDLQSFLNFVKKNVKIARSPDQIPKFETCRVPTLTTIYVENENIRKGLFSSGVYLLNNFEGILHEIKKSPFIYKYYLNLYDFKHSETNSWYVVNSNEMLLRILETKNDYTLYNRIQLDKTKPYFVQLQQIQTTPILLIPCTSLVSAKKISYSLHKDNLLKESDDVDALEKGSTMFVYNSSRDIQIMKFKGPNMDINKILVYKKDDVKYYSVVHLVDLE